MPKSNDPSHVIHECPTSPLIGASYSRFSSDLQRDSSVDDQQRVCRERAAQDGIRIDPKLEFVDRAVSGATVDREGLDALRDAAARGEFSVLYVYSLSRLSRESLFTQQLVKELQHRKVRLISITEGIDSSRAGSDLLTVFAGVQHEWFLRDLSNQVKRGQEGTVLAGFSAGDTCYGYCSVPSPDGAMTGRGRNVKPRKVYAVDNEAAAWVVQIFRWFAEDGRSVSWIVRELNQLKVPKDRRATRDGWYRDLVMRILRNEKYIGRWRWRTSQRSRDFHTRNVRQNPVPEHERDAFLRERPDLQIVESQLFEKARSRLAANCEVFGKHRGAKGRLTGSPSRCRKRFLLDGILACKSCGRRFVIADNAKRYYACLGHDRGQCGCVTTLPRQLAEEMIYVAVTDKLLHCSEWRERVFQATRAVWRKLTKERPDETAALRARKAELETAIRRLLNVIEQSDDPPSDITARLAERRRELRDVTRDLSKLEAGGDVPPEEPTADSIAIQLDELFQSLRSGTPAAVEAFQGLIDGAILLEEVPVQNRKRKFLTAELRLRPSVIATALLSAPVESAGEGDDAVVVPLDFRRTTITEAQARQAQALWESGMSCAEIASELEVTASRVTAIFKFAQETLGLPYPDTRRRRPAGPLYTSIEPEVMAMWDAGMLIHQITTELGVCHATVHTVVKRWHERNGLPMPDGRSRRKSLPVKQRVGPNAPAPESPPRLPPTLPMPRSEEARYPGSALRGTA